MRRRCAAIVTTEPLHVTHPGNSPARKKQGDLAWPEHIEAALIEGQRILLTYRHRSFPFC